MDYSNEQNEQNEQQEEAIITPWAVSSKNGINYKRLIEKFGTEPITGEMIKRIERLTNMRAHPWLRRGLFFSQRDLSDLLDAYERNESIYLYTGRGPSSDSMHLGHMIPFDFTKYLQDAFGAILVIQMSDDEKYFFRKPTQPGNLEHFNNLAYKNAQDIIARGFNPDKTYIFANSEEILTNAEFMKNFFEMLDLFRGKDVESIFGIGQENKLSQIIWPLLQSGPAFSTIFPHIFENKNVYCLVPCAIDQDVYFRFCRDFSNYGKTKGYKKPAVILSEFFPALQGANSKMSSSVDAPTTIFLDDTPEQIETKIKQYALSGGGKTMREHKEFGADLTIDVAFHSLLYFHPDDESLEWIAKEYRSGRMTSSQIKKIATDKITEYVLNHQYNKSLVTEDVIKHFFSKRPLDHQRPQRNNIVLYSDEEYSKQGVAFDRYFGAYT